MRFIIYFLVTLFIQQTAYSQCAYLSTEELKGIISNETAAQKKAVAALNFRQEKVISGPTQVGYARCVQKKGTNCERFQEAFYFSLTVEKSYYQIYDKAQFTKMKSEIISQCEVLVTEVDSIYRWTPDLYVFFNVSSMGKNACGLTNAYRILFLYQPPHLLPAAPLPLLTFAQVIDIASTPDTNLRMARMAQVDFEELEENERGASYGRGMIDTNHFCRNFYEVIFLKNKQNLLTFYYTLDKKQFTSFQEKIIAEGKKIETSEDGIYYEWENFNIGFEVIKSPVNTCGVSEVFLMVLVLN